MATQATRKRLNFKGFPCNGGRSKRPKKTAVVGPPPLPADYIPSGPMSNWRPGSQGPVVVGSKVLRRSGRNVELVGELKEDGAVGPVSRKPRYPKEDYED